MKGGLFPETSTSSASALPFAAAKAVTGHPASQPMWESLLAALPAPTFLKDDKQQIVAVSDSFCEFTLLGRAQVIGCQDFKLRPEVGILDAEIEQQVLVSGTPASYQRDFILPQGPAGNQRRSLRVTLARFSGPGQTTFLLGTIEDVTQQLCTKRDLASAVRQMQIASEFDGLTGLANRSQLETNISNCIGDSGCSGSSVAILFVNLNDFKSINVGVGHEAGDELLRICAKRIREAVPVRAVVGRIGGDEFAVLLPTTEALDAGRVAERITEMIQCPVEIASGRREVTCGIGVAMYPRDGATSLDLLRKADQAMHLAKTRKPASALEFYQPSIGKEVERKLVLSRELLEAVKNDQLELYFQPIVRRQAGQQHVVGYEALARWNRGGCEWVSPEEFIPLLEQTGHIVQAGEQVLAKACQFVAAHERPDVYVSVNISGRQLLEDGFVEMAERVIRNAGIQFQQVAFELTESLAMRDNDSEAKILNQLVGLGITLMIDDFGTGYSNLSRLSQLPFKVLKIDRSLLRGVPGSHSETAILETVIRMAGELEMKMVVEGIEEPEQRDHLISLGVDTFQGYLFGKPRPFAVETD